MEAITPLANKSYQDIRSDIQSGDILLCAGTSVFSNLIQHATNSIWSHVAFILRLDTIKRIMVLESVESIGVRTMPFSNYLYNYNGSGKAYPGKIMLARHEEVHQKNTEALSRSAIDYLGYPYGNDEIVRIAARISMYRMGLEKFPNLIASDRTFICSEYVQHCFQSMGIDFDYNEMGFIAPSDFANNKKVTPICYLKTSHATFEHHVQEQHATNL